MGVSKALPKAFLSLNFPGLDSLHFSETRKTSWFPCALAQASAQMVHRWNKGSAPLPSNRLTTAAPSFTRGA